MLVEKLFRSFWRYRKHLIVYRNANAFLTVTHAESAAKLNFISKTRLCNKFLKLLDNRNYMGSTVESSQISNGAALVGVLNVPVVGRVNAYAYAGVDDGTYYLPQGKAVVLGHNPIGSVCNCGVYVNMGDFQGKAGLESYAYLWGKSAGVMVDTMLQLEAAPCPLLTAINGYGVITGIPA